MKTLSLWANAENEDLNLKYTMETHEHGDLRLKYNGKHVVVEIFAQGITKYRAQKKVEPGPCAVGTSLTR